MRAFVQGIGRLLLLAAVLVLAVLLGVRVGLQVLNDERINRLALILVPASSFHVVGTEVAWRGWRPQLRFSQVSFGASVAREVFLELDPLQSLKYRVPVFERAATGQLELRLARTEVGWALAAMPPAAGFNWGRVLWRSRALTAVGMVEWIDGSSRSRLKMALKGMNDGAEHRIEVALANESCPTRDCSLKLSLHTVDTHAGRLPKQLFVRSGAGGLTVPSSLTGERLLRLEDLLVRITTDTPATVPELALAGRLSLGSAKGSSAETDIQLVASGNSHAAGGQGRFIISLPRDDAGRNASAGLLQFGEDYAAIAVGSLALSNVRAVVAAMFPADARLRRWVDALALRGTAQNAVARYRFADRQLAWRTDLKAVSATSYRGTPTVAGLNATLTGYERGFRARVAMGQGRFGFPSVFDEVWALERLIAAVELHVREDYLGVWSRELDVTLADPRSVGAAAATRATGSFRLALTEAEKGRRLAFAVGLPATSVALAKQFLPAGLSTELKTWLRTAPRDGQFQRTRLAYVGDLQPPDVLRETARRLALQTDFVATELAYADAWPRIEAAAGTLQLSGRRVFAQLRDGESQGIGLAGSRLRLAPASGVHRVAELDLKAALTVDQGLAFVRASPLLDSLSFIEPDWQGAGQLDLGGSLQLPLGADLGKATGLLDVALKDSALVMPGYGLAYSSLRGQATLQLPDQVNGHHLTGRLHGEPFQFSVASQRALTRITFSGTTTPLQVTRILALPALPFAEGSTHYEGSLKLPLAGAAATDVPQLTLSSELVGLGLALPGELAKQPRTARPTQLTVSFQDQEQWLSLAQDPVAGWFTAREGTVVDGHAQVRGTSAAAAAGSVASFTTRRPEAGTGGQGIRLTGGIGRYDLGETSPETSLGGAVLVFDNFHIAALSADTAKLGRVELQGTLSDTAMAFTVAGARLNGRVSAAGEDPMLLDFDSVLLADPYAAGTPLAQLDTRVVTDALKPTVPDPLALSLLDELPAARVRIGALTYGEEDFGSWRFDLLPVEQGMRVLELKADCFGLHIVGEEILWNREPNETVFTGTISGGALQDILPHWGYESPMTTETLGLGAAVTWAGSPLNLLPMELEGELEILATNGRFEEVEAAGNNALRLLSLLNFNALTRRMNLDFSDVFGRGISFEEITTRVALDHGHMAFLDPLEIDGTGSRFVLNGTVDLKQGLLDNELIVTLPLTKGLPWYAAYVALANPLAGIGVLLGERVLRKPLEQFSSAKYEVTGAIAEPEVKLVGIFNNKLNKVVTDPEELDSE